MIELKHDIVKSDYVFAPYIESYIFAFASEEKVTSYFAVRIR